ncbi:NAD(P)-binding domain-containing protein [Streptomyces canus]|uniref:NAD(P)-binding domain-containing protein n=1 Tax=Streptomyces canus TaxID=58343 RepID=UPI003688D657
MDAPVSGGGGAAAEPRLLVMAGGQEADLARCRPIFDTFADPVIHLGPLVSGQRAKLLNNFVFTAQVALALDTFTLADGLGIDRAAVAQVLAHGTGGSRAAVSSPRPGSAPTDSATPCPCSARTWASCSTSPTRPAHRGPRSSRT